MYFDLRNNWRLSWLAKTSTDVGFNQSDVDWDFNKRRKQLSCLNSLLWFFLVALLSYTSEALCNHGCYFKVIYFLIMNFLCKHDIFCTDIVPLLCNQSINKIHMAVCSLSGQPNCCFLYLFCSNLVSILMIVIAKSVAVRKFGKKRSLSRMHTYIHHNMLTTIYRS